LSCNSADFYISPEFSPTTNEACRPGQSIESSLRPDAKDLAKRAEVTLLGRFHNDDDAAFSPDQLRFSFEVFCVEQATAIPDSTPWPSEKPKPAPVIEGRRAILKTTIDWMTAFIDGKVGPEHVFSRDYRLTTPDGRTLTRDEAVASLIDRQGLGEVSFPFESMLIHGDAAIVRGRLIIKTGTPSTGKTTTYAYTNGYFKDHGVWRVVTTHLSLLK